MESEKRDSYLRAMEESLRGAPSACHGALHLLQGLKSSGSFEPRRIMRTVLLRGCSCVAVTLLCAALAGCADGGADLAASEASGASAVSSGSAASAATAEAGEVAAYVGDATISEADVTDHTQRFRTTVHLEEDGDWAHYLKTRDMTPKTWREEVIRQMADRLLVEKRAGELGIEPDEAQIAERLAQMREDAGATDDDAAWAEYLEQIGQTPEELRGRLELSSLESQLMEAEGGLDGDVRDEMCDDYIHTYLADQVVRRYCAYRFDSEDEADALIGELAALDGEALRERFAAALDGDASPAAADVGEAEGAVVDLGWDFVYDEASIDPDLLLRRAKLEPGALYGEALAGVDGYRVVYCAERHDFSENETYASIQSPSLSNVIVNLTTTSQWAALHSRYLSDLETEANVQVVPMPDGLPYDVED